MITTTRTPADFPMPDLDCPRWCQADHAGDWQQHVAVGLDTRRIPAEGGGLLPDTRLPFEQWCTLDYFLLLHRRLLAEVPLSAGSSDREVARIDLQSLPGEAPSLFVDVQGDLTPVVARRLAAALDAAAATIDEYLLEARREAEADRGGVRD